MEKERTASRQTQPLRAFVPLCPCALVRNKLARHPQHETEFAFERNLNFEGEDGFRPVANIDNLQDTLWIVPMKIDHIPIELDEHGFAGTVRQQGLLGERLPDLIAHRPEPWRFLRLARIVGTARSIADNQLGVDEAKAMIAAMSSISDYKGDFDVVWRLPDHNPVFENILDRALTSEGEDEILHAIESEE